jgi:choice-of-anchor C domain-containing protein
MKALTWTVPAVLAIGVLVEAAPALRKDPTANLVTNGSFEDGPDFEVCKPLDKDATDIKGWVVTRGQIDLCQEKDGNWKAADGKRSLDLHGSPGFGGVRQTLETRAGKKYRVTFQMTGNPQANLTEAKLTVRAAGADKEFAVDMTGVTHEDPKWTKKTWEFTATDRATVLEIHTAMPTTSNAFGGPMVDDVKVVAVD